MLKFRDAWWWPVFPVAAIAAVGIYSFSFAPTAAVSDEKANAQAGNEPDETVGQQETNKRIADYTEMLAILTMALVGVAIIELMYINDATTIATRQTETLANQTALIEKQYEVSQREYMATHRPRIIIRDLEALWPTPGNFFGVKFFITNSGEGVATIVEYGFDIVRYINDVLLAPIANSDWVAIDITSRNFTSGQRLEHEIYSDIDREWLHNETDAWNKKPLNKSAPRAFPTSIVFQGFIIYDDWAGIRRRSSFYREYDFIRARFRPGDDPEREYAD